MIPPLRKEREGVGHPSSLTTVQLKPKTGLNGPPSRRAGVKELRFESAAVGWRGQSTLDTPYRTQRSDAMWRHPGPRPGLRQAVQPAALVFPELFRGRSFP